MDKEQNLEGVRGFSLGSFAVSWEQRKLGDCFTERVESMPDGELISVTINDGIKKFSELGRHDNSNDDKSKYKKVCVGDIAYNSMRMWQGASGYSSYEGIVSPAYTVLSPNSGINSKCLAYQFKLPEMIHTFQVNSQGITSDNWNLKYPVLSKIEIFVSKDEQEQAKIAEYFENLDNLITLHQRNSADFVSRFFSDFTNTWEQRKLGEVLISLQNNTLSRADLSSEKGIAKNIHYGDILVKFGEVIDVKTESLPMIADETVIAKYKSSFLQNGDVIVADTAEDETVGKCTEIAGLSDEIVISGLHTIPYRPLQKYAPGYLGYYMNSASFHNQLLPLMQGIKVTSISKTALQNTDILYPKSATEQAAIGKYFRNLDNLITLHQCEYIFEK